MTRRSSATGAPAPARAKLVRLERGRELVLRAELELGDAVEVQRAALRLVERAVRHGAAVLAAEQRDRGALARQRRARHAHERAGAARAAHVQVARDGLACPVPDSPTMRTGASLAATRSSCAFSAPHGAAAADRFRQARQLALQPLVLLLQAPGLERAVQRQQQLRERDGLLDEVVRAEARRLDRGLDRAVARHHDDRAAGAAALVPLAQQRDAVGVGHPDVEQDEVRPARCGAPRARPRRSRPR